jgi:hypothetical protein
VRSKVRIPSGARYRTGTAKTRRFCARSGDERAQKYALRAPDANFFRVDFDASGKRARVIATVAAVLGPHSFAADVDFGVEGCRRATDAVAFYTGHSIGARALFVDFGTAWHRLHCDLRLCDRLSLLVVWCRQLRPGRAGQSSTSCRSSVQRWPSFSWASRCPRPRLSVLGSFYPTSC